MAALWKMDIKKLIKSPKFYLVIFFIIYFLKDYSTQYVLLIQESGLSITPYLYPIYYSDWFCRMYGLLIIIIMLSDASFIGSDMENVLLRMNRGKWALSRIVYLFFLSVLTQVIFFVISILIFLPNISFSSQWGDVIYHIADFDAEGVTVSTSSTMEVLENYKPLEALLWNMLLVILLSIFLGLLIMIINGLLKNSIGTVFAIVLLTMDFFFQAISRVKNWTIPRWLKLMSWVDLSSISWEKSIGKLAMSQVLLILIIGIILLSGIFYICIRKGWISLID